MSRSARSIFFFSLYLMVIGAGLVIIPNVLLNWFGLPSTQEVWIRVVGMLVFILGVYYLLAARSELKPFFRWTIYGRLAGCLTYIGLVALDLAPTIFLMFALVDFVTALWTWHGLKHDRIPAD